jgi:Protein of unknown function (DUF1566)
MVWRIVVAALVSVCLTREGHAACLKSVLSDGTPRFQISFAEVRDLKTGLIWQTCSLGMTWSAQEGCAGERASHRFKDAVAAAGTAGHGWRLPTASELASLIDDSCGKPAIDTSVFRDVPDLRGEGDNTYWTSTPAGIDDMMYFIDFVWGSGDSHSPGYAMHVRLVRGTMAPK